MIVPFEKKIIEPNGKGLWFPGKPVHFNFSSAALMISGCGCCEWSGDYFTVGQIFNSKSVYAVDEGVVMWDAYPGGAGGNIALDSSFGSVVSRLNSTFIYRYDFRGNELWNRDLSSYHHNKIQGVAVDASNIYVGSQSSLLPPPTPDWPETVFKYNSDATSQIWEANIGANQTWGLAVDISGNVYVAGSDLGIGNLDVAWKLNSSGVEQWNWGAGAGGAVFGTGVAVDSSGNVYVCGAFGNNKSVVKLNSAGVEQWSYNIQTTCQGIAVDGSGNVYVATIRATSPGVTPAMYELWKFNSSGIFQWGYDFGAGSILSDVAIGADGYIYCCGLDYGNKNAWRFDSSGNLLNSYDHGASMGEIACQYLVV